MTQFLLNTAATLPTNGTPTSTAAAAKAQPSAANDRAAILELLAHHPEGLTQDVIAARTGIKLQTVCARINDLGNTGHVIAHALPGLNLARNRAMRFSLPAHVPPQARDPAWPPSRSTQRREATRDAHARISELAAEVESLKANVQRLEQYLQRQAI